MLEDLYCTMRSWRWGFDFTIFWMMRRLLIEEKKLRQEKWVIGAVGKELVDG